MATPWRNSASRPGTQAVPRMPRSQACTVAAASVPPGGAFSSTCCKPLPRSRAAISVAAQA